MNYRIQRLNWPFKFITQHSTDTDYEKHGVIFPRPDKIMGTVCDIPLKRGFPADGKYVAKCLPSVNLRQFGLFTLTFRGRWERGAAQHPHPISLNPSTDTYPETEEAQWLERTPRL